MKKMVVLVIATSIFVGIINNSFILSIILIAFYLYVLSKH